MGKLILHLWDPSLFKMVWQCPGNKWMLPLQFIPRKVFIIYKAFSFTVLQSESRDSKYISIIHIQKASSAFGIHCGMLESVQEQSEILLYEKLRTLLLQHVTVLSTFSFSETIITHWYFYGIDTRSYLYCLIHFLFCKRYVTIAQMREKLYLIEMLFTLMMMYSSWHSLGLSSHEECHFSAYKKWRKITFDFIIHARH